MAKHLERGKNGETLAARFLMTKRYTILAQNWRYKRLEVDIIAKKENIVVFIEVKTRSGLGFGTPENFVDTRKQKLLIEAAGIYLENSRHEGEIRFDIISVYLPQKGTPKIEHFEDAFWDYGA